MIFLERHSRNNNDLTERRDTRDERRLSCSLWIALTEVKNDRSLIVCLENAQREMDAGAVPGFLSEAIEDGENGADTGARLDALGRTKKAWIPSAVRELPMPFPVWLASSFDGLDSVCELQTRFGPAGVTVRKMFELSAKRNAGVLLAWRPFLMDFARGLVDEALAVSAGKELNDCVLPSGAKTAKSPPRAV